MRKKTFKQKIQLSPAKAIIMSFMFFFAVVAAALFFSGRGGVPERENSHVENFIDYQGHLISVFKDVDKNEYASEAFYSDDRFTRYDSTAAKCGIDVSIHQGEIDWHKVALAGVDFAMIRVGFRGYGTGEIYPDENFTANIEGALDAGIDVGVYFFSQAISDEEAKAEAEFTISALTGYDLAYPVVFDWETISSDTARTTGLSGEITTACAAAFCETVKAAGYDPAVYFNVPTGYLIYDLSVLDNYRFWLAQYNPYPDFYYHFDIWQYTDTGVIPGIDAYVDLNVCFYDNFTQSVG